MPDIDSNGESVLTVDSVAHRFGSVTVLDDLSMTVEPGSLVAVIGPNGSGKTTFLRIVVGLLAPSQGAVQRPNMTIRPVGYLPQQPQLRDQLSVQETVAFYQSLLDDSTDTENVLSTIGLEDVPDRRVRELSGGMRQLLGLGIATLGDPPLIVLDEPTSGLDPRNTEYIFQAVEELTRNDTSVILTTHDLAHLDHTDEIAVLNEGQFIVRCSPAELRDRTGEDTIAAAFQSMLGTEAVVQTGADDE